MAGNIHAPKITEIAKKLVLESGSYYGAAKRLGNPNLRASLYRLLNEASFKPSKEIMKALLNSADIKLVAFEAHPDSEIFDPAKLLAMGQIVAILVIPPRRMETPFYRVRGLPRTDPPLVGLSEVLPGPLVANAGGPAIPKGAAGYTIMEGLKWTIERLTH